VNQRLRKPLAIAALVFALLLAWRAWNGGGRTVDVVYDAPPGDLQVTLLDARDQPIRKVFFAAGTERRHSARLPQGALTAKLDVNGRRIERDFSVGEEDVVEIRAR
jgi:hypothetical protein